MAFAHHHETPATAHKECSNDIGNTASERTEELVIEMSPATDFMMTYNDANSTKL